MCWTIDPGRTGRSWLAAALSICLTLAGSAFAQEPAPPATASARIPLAEGEVGDGASTYVVPAKPSSLPPEFAPINDDPRLPRVLLIGDSVSVAYTLMVRKELAGKANVHRIPDNGGSTKTALGPFGLVRWLPRADEKWDVIHFNFGLHDASYRFADGKDKDAQGNYAGPHNGAKPNVPLDLYEKNLHQIVARLRTTGATLNFATTTPIPDSKAEKYVKGSEEAYNAVARRVMAAERVAINDLWSLAKPKLDQIQLPRNVHFGAEGSAVLAKQVAAAIRAAIPAR